MKGKRLAWIFAGAMAASAWTNRNDFFPPPPLKVLVNTDATPDAKIRAFRVPSLIVPADKKEIWRVRLGARPMAAGGHHLFLEFVPYEAKSRTHHSRGEVFQLHGVAMNRDTHEYADLDFKNFDTYKSYFTNKDMLKVIAIDQDFDEGVPGHDPDTYVDVFYGSKDEVLKFYLDAIASIRTINQGDDSYRLLLQNSNSVIRTALDGLGLPIPDIFEATIAVDFWRCPHVWTPAFNKSLLPRGWDREKARRDGGYANLSGAALEKAATDASQAAGGVWPNSRNNKTKRPSLN